MHAGAHAHTMLDTHTHVHTSISMHTLAHTHAHTYTHKHLRCTVIEASDIVYLRKKPLALFPEKTAATSIGEKYGKEIHNLYYFSLFAAMRKIPPLSINHTVTILNLERTTSRECV